MKNFSLGLLVAVAACAASASAASIWTDSFDSYTAGSQLGGQGGWTDTSGTKYAITPAAGGVAGSQGISTADNTAYWTSHSWSWSSLNVGDKVVAKADFQASPSNGGFDDDRVGWGDNATQTSSYHFGTQLDTAQDGGLVTYLRDNSGNNVKSVLISTAILGTIVAGDWYRQELDVTKLTSAVGANGAQLTVYYSHLDASGNVIGTPLTASMAIDTSAWRGFSTTVDPIYKNYSGTANGNMDNAYFALVDVPEPAACGLWALGALSLVVRRRRA